jgi:hypothetical protein
VKGNNMAVAVLFADPRGVYSSLSVDIWCIKRDARNYDDFSPVVCHPPCQLWGRFAKVNFTRWGGKHNKPFNDKSCFSSALFNVRRVGGVLEHPAFSYAWEFHGLSKPDGIGWKKVKEQEYVCEVWQSAYGHKARKRTWLFYKGAKAPKELRWEKKEGTHQIGFYDQRGRSKNRPTISGRAASATPLDFAIELIELAKNSSGASVDGVKCVGN